MLKPHTLEPSWQPRWVHCAYENAGDMARDSVSVVTSGHALQVAVMDTVVRPQRQTQRSVPSFLYFARRLPMPLA